jgi:phosphate acetyltransferase
MAKSIFVTATERGSGKTALVLGLAGALERTLGRVGYFKPIGHGGPDGVDPDVLLMKEALGLEQPVSELCPVTIAEASEAVARGGWDAYEDKIITAYARVLEHNDFVLVEGTDYTGAIASLELDMNVALSKNLGTPILLVASGDAIGADVDASVGSVVAAVGAVKESFEGRGGELVGVVLNRVDAALVKDVQKVATEALKGLGVRLLGTVPRADLLEKPRLDEIVAALGAEVVSGDDRLDGIAHSVIVGAMNVENVLKRVHRGALVVTPGDREDVLLGLAAAYTSPSVPSPSGVVMTCGLEPQETVKRLLVDMTQRRMPMLKVETDTYETAVRISNVKASLKADQRARVDIVRDLVEQNVDVRALVARSGSNGGARRMTPKQFLHRVTEIARADKKRIVLPEGREERILKAADQLLSRGIVDVTLLGPEAEIQAIASRLGLKLPGAQLIDPAKHELREKFAKRYQELRAPKKNPTWELAYDLMTDVNYFGTMMVKEGLADGMVSGSIHTTAATLRPALEFVKTMEGVDIASSVFFMCLPETVLVYGDCAVNPNPTAAELADIAIASADTAKAFEIEPRVAMLSYSTGASGKGEDVDKVREATRLVKERRPDLLVEGPIQYDAAVDPTVAKTKLPDSPVAGQATVLVFPDLNSGNNTYKAVQRSAHAIAVGPVMQGLRRPVNDLSRGALVSDIVNTVAITAIQAQRSKP